MQTIAIICTIIAMAFWVYLPCFIVYCAFTDTNN